MLKPVTLGISWDELFGEKSVDMTAAERRERWAHWVALSGEEEDQYWTDVGVCYDEETGNLCHLLDKGWCTLMGLPCGVSPITTMKMGMGLGRACMCEIPKPDEETQLAMW